MTTHWTPVGGWQDGDIVLDRTGPHPQLIRLGHPYTTSDGTTRATMTPLTPLDLDEAELYLEQYQSLLDEAWVVGTEEQIDAVTHMVNTITDIVTRMRQETQ